MNILFVCKYNRFRSKVAEAFFNKNNKNKNNKSKSAGIIAGNPLAPEVIQGAKDCDIIIKGTPQSLSSALLEWQDIIVVVANDVPLKLFEDNEKYGKGKKIIVWEIEDTKTNNSEEMKRIMQKIEKQVNLFIDNLNKENK